MRSELGVYDRITWEFVRWTAGFRRRVRPRILTLLDAHRRGADVVVLRGRRDVRRWLAGVAAGSHEQARTTRIR